MIINVQNTIRISVESRLEFTEKLDYLNRVFKDSMKNINTDIEDIENKYYDELGHDLTDLSFEEYEFHSAEISKLQHAAKHFPQILYKSTVVSIHSIFESTLARISMSIEKKTSSKIKMKQLRTVGNEIDNILNYLRLVHNLEFDNLDVDLTKLSNYIKIRNCIVHQNASISQLDQSNKGGLKKAIDNLDDVSVDENQTLEFNPKFVKDYIAFVHKFGYKLFEQIIIQK